MPSLTLLDRLIPAYRAKVLTRALENEIALKNSGYLTKKEFDDLKDRMVNAYKRIGKTSAPVIHADEYGGPGFLVSGEYKNQFGTGTSNGILTPQREKYSRSVYGYVDPVSSEKYGAVPLDELSRGFSKMRQEHFSFLPEFQYGEYRIHLKPEVKHRSTINPFDSSNQWPDDVKFFPTSPHATFFPVPYDVENPEDYVGAMMDVPDAARTAHWDDVDFPSEERARIIRERNFSTLDLLEGNDQLSYIEAHVHGPVKAEDVDFIEMPKRRWNRHPVGLPDISEREWLKQWADRYNINLLASEDYDPDYISWESPDY